MNAIFWKAALTEWLLRQADKHAGGMMQRACIEVHQLIFENFDEIEDLAQEMAAKQAPQPMSELHPEVKDLIARVAALEHAANGVLWPEGHAPVRLDMESVR